VSEIREPTEIVVCMGSSCFVRGNAETLSILKEYAAGAGAGKVRLNGCLCQDNCRVSPNIRVGGRMLHGVTPEKLRLLLNHLQEPWDESWRVLQTPEL
jgi:NADH:ubiquinone oxidoreductase subunit E